jgi:CSLREA domain-containing protein
VGFVGSVVVSLALAASASANPITVNSTADTMDDGSICTLRDAIRTANITPSGPFVPAFGGCAAPTVGGADTITFMLGAGPNTIQLGSQLPTIQHDLTITGPGAGLLTVRGEVDAMVPEAYPIFLMQGDPDHGGYPASVTLEGMTVTKGSRGVAYDTGPGGITLNGMTVTGNTADTGSQVGTAILNGAGVESGSGGNVTINDSTISQNSATATTTGAGTPFPDGVFTLAGGAGVSLPSGGTLNIARSTISGNTATASGNQTASAGGAGIANNGGSTTITNSTISGNTATATMSEAAGAGASADASGAGIGQISVDPATLTLDRVTLSGNTASANASQGGPASASGGGIRVGDFGQPMTTAVKGSTLAGNAVSGNGTLQGANVDMAGSVESFSFLNTIIATASLPGGVTNCFNESANDFTSLGYNVTTDFSGDDTDPDSCMTPPTTGDQTSTTGVTDSNLNLGSLQDNGGPTKTIAPGLGSVAVDKGSNDTAAATTDQRGTGFARTFDMTPSNADDGTDVGAFEQQLSASPTSHNFGSVAYLMTSGTQSFTMGNRTGNALPAGTVVGGTNAVDFQTSNDTCTNLSVPNNTGCALDVAFHPVSGGNGAKSGALLFSVSPVELATLAGTTTGFTPASLGVTPTMNDFGTTTVGTPTAATQFTVTNTGLQTSGALTVALTGANASDFGITQDNCTGQTLAGSGGNCTVSVRFAPTSAGTGKSASLAISGTPGGTPSATLSGNANAVPTPPGPTPSTTPSPTTTPGPTGQRDAALKKCKKKKGAARKKCKKKAQKLPV